MAIDQTGKGGTAASAYSPITTPAPAAPSPTNQQNGQGIDAYILSGSGLLNEEANTTQNIDSTELQQGISTQQYNDQLANLQTNYGYEQQQNALTSAGLNLNETELGQQQGQQQAQQGFEETGYQNTLSQLQNQFSNLFATYGQTQTASQENAAGAGTYNTKGYADTVAANQQAFNYSDTNLTLQQQQANTSQAAEESGYNYSQQQDTDAQIQLSQQFQQLGLTQQEQNAALSQAQQSLGLQNAMSQSEFQQQVSNLAAGQYSSLSGLENELISAAPSLGGIFGQQQ